MILGGREVNTELLEIMKMDIKRCEVLSGKLNAASFVRLKQVYFNV